MFSTKATSASPRETILRPQCTPLIAVDYIAYTHLGLGLGFLDAKLFILRAQAAQETEKQTPISKSTENHHQPNDYSRLSTNELSDSTCARNAPQWCLPKATGFGDNSVYPIPHTGHGAADEFVCGTYVRNSSPVLLAAPFTGSQTGRPCLRSRNSMGPQSEVKRQISIAPEHTREIYRLSAIS